MTDRGKVLKGLECCCQMNGAVCRTECPYRDECIKNECVGTAHLCANALELLKRDEQTIESLERTIDKLTKALAEKPDVVRCKDCKHRDPEDHKCDCGHDIQWQLPRANDWFCADGKRR